MEFSASKPIPIPSFRSMDSNSKSRAINWLLYGNKRQLNKVCKEGRYIHKTNFFLLEEQNGYVLQWISRKKLLQSSRILLDKSVQINDQSHKLRKNYIQKLDDKKRHLTIKYGKNKTLVIEFDNEEEREMFKFGLEYFIRRSQILHDLFEMEKSFRANFEETLHNIVEPTSASKFKSPIKSSVNLNNSGSKQKDKSPSFLQISIPDFKHLKELSQVMGLNVEIEYLNILYDKFRKDENIAEINFDKFKDLLIQLLSRSEVMDVYLFFSNEEEKQIDNYAPYMSNLQLQEFFMDHQYQTVKIEDINEIIKKSLWSWSSMSASIILNSMNERLSFIIFSRILLSENNSIFSHEKSLVYQNMDRPLNDYFINGLTKCFSHENHFFKPQDYEAFLLKALDKGTRHLEIFITNHEDNTQEAVLIFPENSYESPHSSALLGYQPIFLKEVLKILKENAFLNNPFPFFLSLKMGKDSTLSEEALHDVILERLGQESIFSLPVDHKIQEFLPSPKELQRKFLLIFSGNLPDIKQSSEYLIPLLNTTEISENDGSEAGSEEGILDENPGKVMSVYSNRTSKANFHVLNNKSMIMRFDDAGSEEDEEEEKRNPAYKFNYDQNLGIYFEHIKNMIRDPSSSFQNDIDKKLAPNIYSYNGHPKDSGELSQKIFARTIHKHLPKKHKPKIKALKSSTLLPLGAFFETKMPLDKPDDDIFKINTLRSKDLHKHPESDLIEFHKRHLSIVYNILLHEEKALFFYQTGAQINCLQRPNPLDLSILANFSKFQENGGANSGYLLKPTAFLHDSKVEQEDELNNESVKPRLQLNITILSASQLKSSTNKRRISPFVEVGLIGGFCIDEQSNKVYRTMVIENNGYNPIFEDRVNCEFLIYNPEMTVIYMQVWDEEENSLESKFLGWFGVPVTCIRPGIRIAPLRDGNLGLIDKSLLLCKIELKNLN